MSAWSRCRGEQVKQPELPFSAQRCHLQVESGRQRALEQLGAQTEQGEGTGLPAPLLLTARLSSPTAALQAGSRTTTSWLTGRLTWLRSRKKTFQFSQCFLCKSMKTLKVRKFFFFSFVVERVHLEPLSYWVMNYTFVKDSPTHRICCKGSVGGGR